MPNVYCIVEGHGECEAVPTILRRLGQSLCPELPLNILPPLRIGRHKLVKKGELERAVDWAARRTPEPRVILVLLDADDDCPKTLGPALLTRAKEARKDVPIGVVLAKREFEAWFLAAFESIGGHRGLAPTIPPIPDPESIRDAKGFLTGHMSGNRAYSPVVDQPALAAVFDMQAARRRSDSFDKFCREIERLFQVIPND